MTLNAPLTRRGPLGLDLEMQHLTASGKPSLLANPLFFPAAIVTLIIGNACDLIGTYIAQPHFEDEANLVHNFLLSHGYYLGWPGAIFGKTLTCLLFAWGLRLFLTYRRQYYPSSRVSKAKFFSTYLYGRPLNFVQQLYSLPHNYRAALYFIGAVCGLSGPYFFYLGYENLAATYGWWHLPFFQLGQNWIDSAAIVSVILLVFWLRQQIWNDYQSIETVSEK